MPGRRSRMVEACAAIRIRINPVGTWTSQRSPSRRSINSAMPSPSRAVGMRARGDLRDDGRHQSRPWRVHHVRCLCDGIDRACRLAAPACDPVGSGSGRPACAVDAVPYAPHMMNSPWARVMTPIIPKITATPHARARERRRHQPIDRAPRRQALRCPCTNRVDANSKCGAGFDHSRTPPPACRSTCRGGADSEVRVSAGVRRRVLRHCRPSW